MTLTDKELKDRTFERLINLWKNTKPHDRDLIINSRPYWLRGSRIYYQNQLRGLCKDILKYESILRRGFINNNSCDFRECYSDNIPTKILSVVQLEKLSRQLKPIGEDFISYDRKLFLMTSEVLNYSRLINRQSNSCTINNFSKLLNR